MFSFSFYDSDREEKCRLREGGKLNGLLFSPLFLRTEEKWEKEVGKKMSWSDIFSFSFLVRDRRKV